tara:strand:- start:10072 stop:10902 length:831 start_codon:yes stop_codon:yes gene_type:complete
MTVTHIVQKKVLFKEHSSEYLTVFCLLTVILLLPFTSKVTFTLSGGTLLLIYVLSLIAVTSWLLLIKAYKHMEVSIVEPFRNISPLVVLILAFFFLGEKISWINGLGIALIVGGGYFLEAAINHANLLRPFSFFKGKYMHFIVFSLLIGGIVHLVTRIAINKTDSWTVLFFLFFFASINTLLLQFVKYQGMQDIIYVLKTNGWLVILVVITTLISNITYFTVLAMPTTYLALIIALRRLGSLFTTIIGGEIFHESRLLVKSIACLIMLSGVYFIIL